MAGSRPKPSAFRAERYELSRTGLWLSAIAANEADALGALLVAIEPWSHYGTTAANLASLFAPAADGGIRLALRSHDCPTPIGVAVIRHPWLAGPYMQFLAIIPGYQRRGLGHAILNWFEAEARSGGARNAWICAVSINSGALKLYANHGYERVAVLDDLIKPGLDEILMRKKLIPSDN
jgi:diamine N-acetyltransferase